MFRPPCEPAGGLAALDRLSYRAAGGGRSHAGGQELGSGVRRVRPSRPGGRAAVLPPVPAGLHQHPGVRVDLPGLVPRPFPGKRCDVGGGA